MLGKAPRPLTSHGGRPAPDPEGRGAQSDEADRAAGLRQAGGSPTENRTRDCRSSRGLGAIFLVWNQHMPHGAKILDPEIEPLCRIPSDGRFMFFPRIMSIRLVPPLSGIC